jgi:transcriptional regulator with XRE-family HTH domain
MDQDWKRLADAIRGAREAAGMTQIALAEAANISEGSVQNLESGMDRNRIPPSLAKVERALGWATGSGVAILRGADPVPTSRVPAGRRRPSTKLPLRIVDELQSDDPLIDSTVIQLPGVDGARMTVVVHGRPDATPEEIQEALLAWRNAERRLRHLGEGE